MKRQVRRGAFETNSSSTHAICITKSKYRHNSFSHIDFETGEFGWENDEYDSLYNKASYLITAILSFDKDEADENLQKLKDILDSNNIEYTLPELKLDIIMILMVTLIIQVKQKILSMMYYRIQISYLGTYLVIR